MIRKRPACTSSDEPITKKQMIDISENKDKSKNTNLFLDVISIKDIFDKMIQILFIDNFEKTILKKKIIISKENLKVKQDYYIYTPANILLILFGYSEIRKHKLNCNDVINLKIIHCKYLCFNNEKSNLKFPYYKEYIYFLKKLINYGIFKNQVLIARKNYNIISYTDNIKNETDINKKQKLLDFKEKLMISKKNNIFKEAFIKKIFIHFANTLNVKSNRGPCSDYDIKHFMNKYFNDFLRIERNNSEFWNELNQTIFKINVSYIYHCHSISLTNKHDAIRFIHKHSNFREIRYMSGTFDFKQIPIKFYTDIDISSRLFYLNISEDRTYHYNKNYEGDDVPYDSNYRITIIHYTSYFKKCIDLKIIQCILSFIEKGTDWIGTLSRFIKEGSQYVQIVFTKKDNVIFDKEDVKIINNELVTKYIPEELYDNLKEYHRLYPKYTNAHIMK